MRPAASEKLKWGKIGPRDVELWGGVGVALEAWILKGITGGKKGRIQRPETLQRIKRSGRGGRIEEGEKRNKKKTTY